MDNNEIADLVENFNENIAVGDHYCPMCGAWFYIPSTEWVYKYKIPKPDGTYKVMYFHTYSCKRKFEKEYEETKKKKRSDAARKAAITRKATINKRIIGRTCSECEHCKRGKYGFFDCLYFGWSVPLHKNACRMFREGKQCQS